jgi:chaperonin GroES
MLAEAVALRPIGTRLIVRREEDDDVTPGGIVIPDQAKEKKTRGRVVAVGSGRLLDNGTRVPLEVSEGDVVHFQQYAMTAIDIDGEEWVVLNESDILAVESRK